MIQVSQSARTEIETAVASGDSVCAERVFGRYPELAGNDDSVLEVIYFEYVLRQEVGQDPKHEEYYARFPRLADRLKKLFEFERMLQSGFGIAETEGNSATESIAESIFGAISGPVEEPLRVFARKNSSDKNPAIAKVGDYDCMEVIGRGGMGVVYRAIHRTLGRVTAIKMIHLIDCMDQHSIERFLSEARVACMLNHPSIVQIYETGVVDGVPFYAMEYMPAGSLETVLKDGPLHSKVAAEIVLQLARAVEVAHANSIIHRDIKPGNVLLAPSQGEYALVLRPAADRVELKIADFGLARCLTDPTSQTLAGVPIGTPSYMAPEQIGLSTRPDHRCDIYSLGALMFHLLVGKPPFQAPTSIETMQLVLNEEPVALRTIQSTVPRDLETICLKCLQKDRERRYSSAGAVADDLQRFLDCKPILARPAGPIEKAMKWTKRNPLQALLLALMVITAVTTTALWFRADHFRRTAERATVASEAANQQALATLRTMTEDIVLEKFAKQNELSEQDREFLNEIADMYGKLAELQQPGNQSQLIRAEGNYWSGVIHSYLAEPNISITYFDEALQLFLKLESVDPSENVYLLANDTMEKLVEMLEHANRVDDAIAMTVLRIDRCQRLPDFLSLTAQNTSRRSMINAYRQLGHLYDISGMTEQATNSWQQARELIEAALIELPENPKLLNSLAGTLRSLSTMAADSEERISLAMQSIDIARSLVLLFPDQPSYQRNLSWSLYDLASIQMRDFEMEAALIPLSEAIAIAERLVQNEPLLDEYRGPLCSFLGSRGEIFALQGRWSDAEMDFLHSIDLIRRNLENSPHSYMLHSQLARSYISLLKLHVSQESTQELVTRIYMEAKQAVDALRQIMEESGTENTRLREFERVLESVGPQTPPSKGG